ncbi:MAG: hypothetical protein JW715_05920 [Sedimentisphaerales bacterium]|nr:hypothetical protein [Sedimentisphaerales bacterium]
MDSCSFDQAQDKFRSTVRRPVENDKPRITSDEIRATSDEQRADSRSFFTDKGGFRLKFGRNEI